MMKPDRAWTIAAIVLPPVLIAAYIFALRPPATDTGDVVNITTGWATIPGVTSKNAADLQGRPSVAVTMPGNAANGPGPGVTWIEREVEIPDSMRGEPLLLFFGDVRTSIATVYWNGHRIGRQAAGKNGIKLPPYGAARFSVPPDLVTAGKNILNVRIEYVLALDAGFADTRNYLGKERILSPFAARYEAVETLIPAGANLVFLGLGAILIALWIIEHRLGEEGARRRYFSTLCLLAAGACFQVLVKGTVVPQWLPNAAWGFAVHMMLGGVGLIAVVEFTEQFWLGYRTWFGRVSNVICSIYVATLAFHLGFSPPDRLLDTYLVFCVWALIAIVYACVFAGAMLWRTRRPFGAVVMSMLVVTVGTHASDIIREVTFHAVSLGRAGIVVQALLASAVAIGGFLEMGARNLQLSSTLSTVNMQLRNALDRAEESTRVKAEFLANISHEVRTPLNAIVNLPEAVKGRFAGVPAVACGSCGARFELDAGEVLSPALACATCAVVGQLTELTVYRFDGDAAETRSDLDLLQSSSRHLLHVVNDILDISRMEANATVLRREHVKVAALVAEAAQVVQPMARAAGVTLAFSDSLPAAIWLHADRVRLVQVLVNLMNNAIKFSSHGGKVETDVRLDRDHVLFTVRDHGVGIAKENHALVFESFRQVDHGNTRSAGGSGLGLAITKHLVVLHGGTIWVTSALGEGAQFMVRLPVSPPPSPSSENAVTHRPPAKA